MEQTLKNDILSLLDKVMEVINNNDWPTEEGHRMEGVSSPIEVLVDRIKTGLETL